MAFKVGMGISLLFLLFLFHFSVVILASRYKFSIEDANILYREWLDKQSPEVKKMVGLISVDILKEEGTATKCGARIKPLRKPDTIQTADS